MSKHIPHEEESVSMAFCKSNHTVIRWLFGLLFTLITVFIVMVGLAVSSSSNSLEASTNSKLTTEHLEAKFDIHEAKDIEVQKHLIASIVDLKAEITKLDKNISELSNKLWNHRSQTMVPK